MIKDSEKELEKGRQEGRVEGKRKHLSNAFSTTKNFYGSLHDTLTPIQCENT